jgi:methionyl-tRNA formyltransferase
MTAPAPLRTAFFGSPEFGLTVLDRLARDPRFEVVLVVAQPDRPAGRGLAMRAPPVARRARELGLPLRQPARVRKDPALTRELAGSGADAAVTAAYGQILPAALLEVPRLGFLNVHGSLLPEYRGAAPVQRALLDGRDQIGVTIMLTDPGMDTGPILAARAIRLDGHELAPDLLERLAEAGSELLADTLPRWAAGQIEPCPQDDARATYAPPLTAQDGRLRPAEGARRTFDRYRATHGWPGLWFEQDERRVKVRRAEPGDLPGAPGEWLGVDGDALLLGCGDGSLRLLEVQPAGKRAMTGAEWSRGARLERVAS